MVFLCLSAATLWVPAAMAQRILALERFDEVNITGNIEATLAAGNTEEVSLYTENIPEDEVTIKVSKGVLKISVVEGIFYKNEKVVVNLTYKGLLAVRGNAGARIDNKSVLEGDGLLLRCGSGARMDLRVELNSLDAGASEGGILSVEGQTDNVEVTASTGGRFEGFNLESRRVAGKANTGGQAEVFATEELEAAANTGGVVTYKGDPESTSFKSVLSGEVKKW